MPSLLDLWLPILLSAVFVFLVSSVLHMVIPLHRNDFGKLPNEEAVLAAMRDAGLGRGDYRFPFGTMKDMATPEFRARCERGPVGTMTLLPPGMMNMGQSLMQWFLFVLVLSLFVGYVASIALPVGVGAGLVFRMTTSAALLGHAFTNVTDSIWKGVRWSTTAKFMFDGLIYSLVTGATFAWLWPDGT